MKLLTSYVNEHHERIVRPLLLILQNELERNEKEVDRNIAHIQNAVTDGVSAIQKAQSDVGMSLDECAQLRDGIRRDIVTIGSILKNQKADSIYGDKILTTVYKALKEKGKVLDVLTLDDEGRWQLGECKFAIRLFTSRMFSGQRTFYESIELKFIDVMEVLDEDKEIHSEQRTIFVLREHYQQCLRQFANLRLGNPEYPIAKENYVLKTIGFD